MIAFHFTVSPLLPLIPMKKRETASPRFRLVGAAQETRVAERKYEV